jgi:hypothetical protein
VEELDDSVSIKIAKEAVMNINKLGSLFKPTDGFLDTKIYFAGLPRKVESALIKPVTVSFAPLFLGGSLYLPLVQRCVFMTLDAKSFG